MRHPFLALAAIVAFPILGTALVGQGPAPVSFFGLTEKGQLVTFTSDAPGLVTSKLDISGLAPGEKLVGIDMRPANSALYGVGDSSRVYRIDTGTGAATAIGAGLFTPALAGTSFGVDFNPQADRLRVVSDAGQNLRIHPDTGAVVLADQPLMYAVNPPDPNTGVKPRVMSAAYVNNVAGATSTALFDLDAATNSLVQQTPPNDGILTTVAQLAPVNLGPAGFDVDSAGNAFVGLRQRTSTGAPPFTRVFLYSIDLTSGQLTVLGILGSRGIIDFAVKLL